MRRGQVAAMIGVRWGMVRGRPARAGFAALAAVVPLLGIVAVVVGRHLPDGPRSELLLLAPTAYLSMALLAVLAPLVAGGGNELFPSEQLVAFPVSTRTHYRTSLALTPLNLAWTAQVVALLGLTAYVTPPGARLTLALATCLAYVALVTVAGQMLAWAVVGARARPGGRTASWAVAGALATGALAVVVTGHVGDVLDAAPTRYVVIGAISGGGGLLGQWALATSVLLGLTLLVDRAGLAACRWALRQAGEGQNRLDAHPLRRRRQAGSARHEALAVDRASVWRSTSLRRGLVVLAVLPGAVAATAGLEWSSLVLLPGLVAAGAGLLFGVNAFCLDGPGAVWRGSLPGRPGTVFWAKAQVVAETCLVAVALTMVAGTVRADRPPTAAEVAALGACAAVVLVRVVALCMELSVRHPHRGDLRGPRDTPAPPGVMAVYSARLAVSTTLVAVLFSALAETGSWRWPVALAVPFLLLSARRLVRTAATWDDELVRARVVSVVGRG